MGAVCQYVRQEMVRNDELKKMELNKEISRQFRYTFAAEISDAFNKLRKDLSLYINLSRQIKNTDT